MLDLRAESVVVCGDSAVDEHPRVCGLRGQERTQTVLTSSPQGRGDLRDNRVFAVRYRHHGTSELCVHSRHVFSPSLGCAVQWHSRV